MINDNKKIAKNTIYLYVGMVVSLLVYLYTSRAILQILGVSDFGIYNVVAGFVALFSFLNNTLASGVQRFYNFESKRKEGKGIQSVYISSLIIHLTLAAIVFVILELFGIWYIRHIMILPQERIDAAEILFHCTTISLLIVIIKIPYAGIIIADERMGYYSFVHILDVVVKLVIVLILPYFNHDKLETYSYLLLTSAIIDFFLYYIYAKRNFPTLKFKIVIDKPMLKSMFSFMSWNAVGTFAFMLKGQGINMLLNFFYGPIVNAARGIAYQVMGAMQGFAGNVASAFRPQMISSYASEDYNRTRDLLYSESKICFAIICTLIIPVILEIDYILALWLGEGAAPRYTGIFTILVLADMLIGTLNTPFTQVIHATGKLKLYQIGSTTIHVLIIPVSWFLMKCGLGPVCAFWVCLVAAIFNVLVCCYVTNKLFYYNVPDYIKKVVLPCIAFSALLPIIPYMVSIFFEEGFLRLVVVILSDIVIAGLLIYYIMLSSNERIYAANRLIRIFKNE